MSEVIMQILYEYQLNEKTLALTTDNASAMVVCGRIIVNKLKEGFDNLYFSHYRYTAYILNLVVQEGLQLINTAVIKV